MRYVSIVLLIIVTLGGCAESGTARYEKIPTVQDEAKHQILVKCQDQYIEKEIERVNMNPSALNNPLTGNTPSNMQSGPHSIDSCMRRHGYATR